MEKTYKHSNPRKSKKTPKKSVSIRVDTKLLEEFKQVARDSNNTEASLWEFGMIKAIKHYKD